MKARDNGRGMLPKRPVRSLFAASAGVTRPAPVANESLAAELEGALVDAIAGMSAGPMVSKTLAREATAILRRHGVEARVVVGRDAEAWTVDILVRPGAPVVRRVVLSVR